MIAFFKPRALFTGTTILKETTNKNLLLTRHCAASNQAHAVVVFSHHRDVKVALDELSCAGFSSDYLTLIARQAKKRLGSLDFATYNCFQPGKFDFNQVAREFFSRLFHKGKYLILIEGSSKDVRTASKIASRRRDRSEVWLFE